jgi:hypothetical protein
MGIVEVRPDIFYVSTTAIQNPTWPSQLWKLDMSNFINPEKDPFPQPVSVLTLPPEANTLNGSCLLSRNVILLADSRADLIWRVDMSEDLSSHSAHVWLKHPWLAHNHSQNPSPPGVNGLKYNPNDQHVYFTSTAQLIFGRIPVNTITWDPAGDPVEVTSTRNMKGDELIIDEVANVCYVTTHRQNTVERFQLGRDSSHSVTPRTSIVGDPVDLYLIGPTAGAWSRDPAEAGRVAYFTTDGGHMNPYEGIYRESRVLRIEFPPVAVP